MKAHVICVNDGIEFVVLGEEEDAQKKLEALRDAYYDRHVKPAGVSLEDYRHRYYWHIHTVECLDARQT